MEDRVLSERASSGPATGADGARHAASPSPSREAWIPKETLCELLEISPRTVDRMVRRGELVRRRAGRESHFRVIDARRAGANAVDGTPEALSQLEDNSELESARRYIARLVSMVDTLAERVATLERERTELLDVLSGAGKIRTVVSEVAPRYSAAKPS
jgi:phage terminase Nu1 subunit (DNA packaging protein)